MIVASIAVIPDAISRAVYIEECSLRLNISEEILSAEVKKLRKKRQYGAYSNTPEEYSEPGIPKYFPPLETGERLPQFITDTYCEPAERELLYYLIKFGEHPLYGTDEENPVSVTVSQFILSELQTDDLELQNQLYKSIFNEYYQIKDRGQEEIQRHFLNHRNQEFVKVVLDLLHQEHNLTIKQFVAEIPPEEHLLSTVVPKSILIYKAKITAIAYHSLCEQLSSAEKESDTAQRDTLMQQIQILMQIRNSFAKELKRLTI